MLTYLSWSLQEHYNTMLALKKNNFCYKICFSFHIVAVYTEVCGQSQFPGACDQYRYILTHLTLSCGLEG